MQRPGSSQSTSKAAAPTFKGEGEGVVAGRPRQAILRARAAPTRVFGAILACAGTRALGRSAAAHHLPLVLKLDVAVHRGVCCPAARCAAAPARCARCSTPAALAVRLPPGSGRDGYKC